MSKRQGSILTFFKRKKKDENNRDGVSVPECPSLPTPTPEPSNDVHRSDSGSEELSSVAGPSAEHASHPPEVSDDVIPINDIGNFVAVSQVSDSTKFEMLKNCWRPLNCFSFPKIRQGKQDRSFQTSWLERFPWLAYSHKLQGGLCRVCVLFGKLSGGKSDQVLGCLVTGPLKNYKKAIEILINHGNSDYHKNNMLKSVNFTGVMEGKSGDIISAVNTAVMDKIRKNKQKLVPIIKTILLCATQNIPLRGHRDDGIIKINPIDRDHNRGNEGNFRALLKFRIDSGDEILKQHLSECPNNASYISKTTQDELISSCGAVLLKQIVSEIHKNRYFTISVDETTDCSIKEQMTVCARFVDTGKPCIKEVFLGFIEIESLTGEFLYETLMAFMKCHGLDIAYLRGQAYDGGSNLSGKFKGLQALIRKVQPLAHYTHCYNHRLNLVISKCSDVPAINAALTLIKSVSKFFRESAARVAALANEMENKFPQKKFNRLKTICETRWVERHDAVLEFESSLEAIVHVLEEMSVSSNYPSTVKTTATSLLHSLSSFQVLIAIRVLAFFLGMSRPLSVQLQSKDMDVSKASHLIQLLSQKLEKIRKIVTANS